MASGLGAHVRRGGAYLTARQLLTMGVSLGGMVVLTRLIGPAAFGMYAGALGLVVGMQALAQLGIKGYMVRRASPDEATEHLAFTWLALLGLAGAALLVAAGPAFSGWLAQADFGRLLAGLALGLPVLLVSHVPMARLERRLDYAGVALVEGAGVVTHHAVALALAAAGWGAWAPVIGWWCHLVVIGAAACRRARYRPRWRVRGPARGEMLREGFRVAAGAWLWQARHLAPPLIVGRVLGVEAMGALALGARLVEAAGFLRPMAQRLALSAFSRLQHDAPALRRALEQGLSLLTLTLGGALVGLTTLGPWLLPRLFGPAWQPVVAVLPYLACGALAHGLFGLASAALHVQGRFRAVVAANGLYAALLLVAGAWLVPSFGLVGYGLAELAASGAYAIGFMAVGRRLGAAWSARTAAWAVGMAMAMFAWPLGPWAWAAPAIALAWPGNRRALLRLVGPGRRTSVV